MNVAKNSAPSTQHSALLPLIALHLAVTLPLAYLLNIWVDEASTLYTTENGFSSALQNALAQEKQAPLYFWVLSLWRALNGSVFFARLLSIIFSVAAIIVFQRLARKFFGPRESFFITAFFALHPFLIWAGLEIRVYSLVILLSVLLLNFFTEAYLQEEKNAGARPRIFFSLTAAAALYANYYLGFVLAGCFAALLVRRNFKAARRFFFDMIFVAAVFAPLVWAIREQFAANTAGFQVEKTPGEALRLLWNHFLTFVFPTELFPTAEQTFVSFIRVWAARFGIAAAAFLLVRSFYRNRKNARRGNDAAVRLTGLDRGLLFFGAVSATVFLFLTVSYFLLGPVYVGLRHAAVWFAPVVLTGFAVLMKIIPRRGLVAFAALYIFLFSYSVFTLYPNLAKRGDWARVAEYIEQNERPGQPIVIFTAFDALALPYYYRGVNHVLPDERFFDFEMEAPEGSAASWLRQTEFIISEIPPDAEEIWLLTNEKCEIEEACRPLENFVRANYNVVNTKAFYLEKVRLLRKK